MALDRSQLGMLATNDVSIVHGDPISLQKAFDEKKWKKPKYIYFVYIRVNENQRLFAEHYFDKLRGRTVEQAEKDLLRNARPYQGQLKPVLTGFDVFDFQDKPCYVSMVIDEEHWHFYPHPVDANIPATILRRNKVVQKKNGELIIEEYSPNYSFYNYERTKIADPDGHDKSAIRFVNFFKKDKFGKPEYVRKDIHSESEQKKQNRYCFDIYIRMPVEKGQSHSNGWAFSNAGPRGPAGDLLREEAIAECGGRKHGARGW